MATRFCVLVLAGAVASCASDSSAQAGARTSGAAQVCAAAAKPWPRSLTRAASLDCSAPVGEARSAPGTGLIEDRALLEELAGCYEVVDFDARPGGPCPPEGIIELSLSPFPSTWLFPTETRCYEPSLDGSGREVECPLIAERGVFIATSSDRSWLFAHATGSWSAFEDSKVVVEWSGADGFSMCLQREGEILVGRADARWCTQPPAEPVAIALRKRSCAHALPASSISASRD